MRELTDCHDCRAKPGEPHLSGCDVARCLATGGQLLQCGGELHEFNGREYGEHEGDCGWDIWTGLWPGVEECRQFDLWCKWVEGHGWVECDKDDPDATESLNELARMASSGELDWSRDHARYVSPIIPGATR